MKAAAAADAGSATTPKRRLRGDRLRPLPGLEKERVVPRKKEEGAAQAKHAPAALAQGPVQAVGQPSPPSSATEEGESDIVKFWHRAKKRRSAAKAAELTAELFKKPINFPTQGQLQRFLDLTNGNAVPSTSHSQNLASPCVCVCTRALSVRACVRACVR